MFDEVKGYNPSDVNSIERYAVQLENKPFFEVVQSKGNLPSDAVMDYAVVIGKGIGLKQPVIIQLNDAKYIKNRVL